MLFRSLLSGCAASFTNLTARQQLRNPNNLYTVEATFHTRQQTLRWETIQPYVKVGSELYPMRPTLLMTNRWEALVPISAATKNISYRYKFDFKYNVFGREPQPDSRISPEYTLKVLDQ